MTDDVAPSDAVDLGGDAADGAAEAASNHGAAEGADSDVSADDVGGGGGGGGTSASDVLLETQPDINPETVADDPVLANCYVAGRKALNALDVVGTGDGENDGTPMVMNLVNAGLATMQPADEEDDEEGAEIEIEESEEYDDPAGTPA